MIQKVAPIPEGDDLLERNIVYPFWPVLDEASFDLGDHKIVLEPGQSLQEVLQFLVPDDVETVLIHYSFYDSRSLGDSLAGWGITDVYDIIDRTR